MEYLLYLAARVLIAFLQALPLPWVARLGRAGGALCYWVDGRHRRMARTNLAASFPEKDPAEITALAKENFRRVGENFVAAVKTASMTAEELAPHLEFHNLEAIQAGAQSLPAASVVVAIGHFGNFELYARFTCRLPNFQGATTYRALRQPSLNRLLQSLREKSGCLYFERRLDGEELRARLKRNNLVLGLLSDQHGGQRGLRLPFFGRDCSTNPAPAVLALRYQLPLFTGFCFRTGLAKWRLEIGEEIPTHENRQPRSAAGIMRDVNQAFERAVRRDPANWFWVHNRWKTPGRPPPQRHETEVTEEDISGSD
jgi:lauroyl/myristoyl acyltransferase